MIPIAIGWDLSTQQVDPDLDSGEMHTFRLCKLMTRGNDHGVLSIFITPALLSFCWESMVVICMHS